MLILLRYLILRGAFLPWAGFSFLFLFFKPCQVRCIKGLGLAACHVIVRYSVCEWEGVKEIIDIIYSSYHGYTFLFCLNRDSPFLVTD